MVTARVLPADRERRSPPAPTTTSASRSRPWRCSRPCAMHSELAALARASALPLTSFRSEHVDQQVERACRREQVDGADGARAGARPRRRGAPPLPPLRRDLARRAVPRPGAVRAARGGAAAAAAGGRRTAERVVGGLLGRRGAAHARARARADGRARPLAAARQRPARGEPRALARARATTRPAVRARMRWERRDLAADGPPPGRWRLVLCRNVAIYLDPGGPPAAVRDARLRARARAASCCSAAASG